MITVILNNYRGQKITYTMPDTAEIEAWKETTIYENDEILTTRLSIDVVCAAGIEVKKEDIDNDN